MLNKFNLATPHAKVSCSGFLTQNVRGNMIKLLEKNVRAFLHALDSMEWSFKETQETLI